MGRLDVLFDDNFPTVAAQPATKETLHLADLFEIVQVDFTLLGGTAARSQPLFLQHAQLQPQRGSAINFPREIPRIAQVFEPISVEMNSIRKEAPQTEKSQMIFHDLWFEPVVYYHQLKQIISNQLYSYSIAF